MSLFRTLEFPCPVCAVPVAFDLVHSINVDRRPDLRMQIIDRKFQQEKCPSCSYTFRVEPEFTILHSKRNQWIAACPASKLNDWPTCEAQSKRAFDLAFGPAAGPIAAAMGKDMVARVTFGWEALREKLILDELGINDTTLELCKIAVMRAHGDAMSLEQCELRLMGIDSDEQMVLGWFQTGTEELKEVISAPKSLLSEIEATSEDWKALRDELTQGLFVDTSRILTTSDATSQQ